jgi:hypothetical protein
LTKFPELSSGGTGVIRILHVTPTEAKLHELLACAGDAAIDALKAMAQVVRNTEASNGDKIKATAQIVSILHKTIDNVELMDRAKKMKEVLDRVNEEVEYHPES